MRDRARTIHPVAALAGFLIGVSVLVCWPGHVLAADCSGRITSRLTLVHGYNPLYALDTLVHGKIRVRNSGDKKCSFALVFIKPPSTGSDDVDLSFYIQDRFGNSVLETRGPGAKPQHSLRLFDIDTNSEADFEFGLRIPAGQMVPPRLLTEKIELRLFAIPKEQRVDLSAQLDSKTLEIEIDVADVLSVNIAGGGTSTTIDFEELTSGETKQILINARSNQKFVIRATSLNGGVLRLPPPFESSFVPYTALISNQKINFQKINSPASIGSFIPTGLGGRTLGLEVSIGDVSKKRAGLYVDEITLTIEPVR